MNTPNTEAQLLDAMKKLEAAADKVVQTSGYTQDAKKMRLLIELIKEQIKNENSLPTTRQVR